MKLFFCSYSGGKAVISAYNRGHAVKMLSKELKALNIELSDDDPVVPLVLENKKGEVLLFKD